MGGWGGGWVVVRLGLVDGYAHRMNPFVWQDFKDFSYMHAS